MAYFDKTEYGKYLSVQNVSGSGDPSDAPEGGIYLFASGTAGSAKLYLQNEGVSSPLSLADAGTMQIAGDSGTDTVNLSGDTFTIAGGEGVVSAVTDNQVSLAVSVADFSTSMTGDLDDADEFAISDGGTMKKVDFSVVRDAVFADVSGDATVAAGGALTIANAAVEHAMLANDAVDGDNIADDSVNSEHIALGALDAEHYSSGSIQTGHLAADAVTAAKLADDAVVTANIVDANVTTAKLAADAVDGTKLADDAVNSEHIALGALDAEHYSSGSIQTGHLAADAVTAAKLADDAVVTANIVDANVTTAKIADAAVTAAKIATAVAGSGLAGGGGSALSLDLNELGDTPIAVGADSIVFVDATDNSSKKDTVADFVAAMAGSGLAASSGVLSADLSELSDASVASGDKFVFVDATDDSTKMESIDDMATFMAGDGLAASSGVLAVGVDDSTIELDSDALRVKADGIDSSHIALGALDAEHYSSGSIQNGHLAGSIANAKLSNSSVTLTQGAGMAALGAVSLGGSITVAVDGVLEDLDTLGAASADGEFIVATGAGAFAYESGNTARTSLGLGTGDSPEFTGLSVSGLTAGRIPFAGSGGALSDEANLQYSADANSIVLDGHFSGSGNAQFGGGIIVEGAQNSFSGSVNIAVNLSAAGNSTFGGGYGSSGATITSGGNLSMDGNLLVIGSATIGASGAGQNLQVFGADSNEEMLFDATNNVLMFKKDESGSQETILTIGGDENTDFAIEVAQGSDNINKIKASAFVTYSDESLKSDVSSMANTALDTVMSLEGVEFTWKNSGERDFGFIAQDVQKVVPQAVHVASDGVQGVDYSRLTSVLVEAVKAQQVQIEELKAILKK